MLLSSQLHLSANELPIATAGPRQRPSVPWLTAGLS